MPALRAYAGRKGTGEVRECPAPDSILRMRGDVWSVKTAKLALDLAAARQDATTGLDVRMTRNTAREPGHVGAPVHVSGHARQTAGQNIRPLQHPYEERYSSDNQGTGARNT